MPPNYGTKYTNDFSQVFQELANEQEVPLIPFLLEGVGGEPSMNLPDGIHPNPEGHDKIAQTVYDHVIKLYHNLNEYYRLHSKNKQNIQAGRKKNRSTSSSES